MFLRSPPTFGFTRSTLMTATPPWLASQVATDRFFTVLRWSAICTTVRLVRVPSVVLSGTHHKLLANGKREEQIKPHLEQCTGDFAVYRILAATQDYSNNFVLGRLRIDSRFALITHLLRKVCQASKQAPTPICLQEIRQSPAVQRRALSTRRRLPFIEIFL